MQLLFCVFLAFSLLTCSQEETNKAILLLKNWELKLETQKNYKKTKIINWESTESGQDENEHNGFGFYKTKFVIPNSWRNIRIAFYTPCIDDADEAYLNGEFIGNTGNVPSFSNTFQSGVREARFYYFPKSLIKWDEMNTIELKVYDYSSVGGFCYDQQPIIGDYKDLKQKRRRHLISNNLPRILVFSITLILIGYMLQYCIFVFWKYKAKSFLSFFIRPMNIFDFISKTDKFQYNFELEMGVRYLYGVFLLLVCAFFLSSEFTFKYQIIELSEDFWFKYPPVSFQIGQLFLLSVIHPDVFGRHWDGNRNFKMLASLATHPVISILILFYLLSLKPEDAWNMFAVVAIFVNTWIMIFLFVYSGFQLIESKKIVEKNLSIIVYRQGWFRIFLGFCSLALYSLVFFYPEPSVRFHIRRDIFLFLTIILCFFCIFSLYFSHKYKLTLPIKPKEKKKPIALFSILQTEYKLTYNEAQIAYSLYEGMDRDSIKVKYVITEGTLKNHLKSIYSKTIDKQPIQKKNERRKLYRLISFLHELASDHIIQD